MYFYTKENRDGSICQKDGPTFKKSGHRAEEYIQKLKVLNEEAAGKIKEDIEIIRYVLIEKY